MKYTIAVVDPASYALTYDYQYIKALSLYYDVDFYCSSTKYNDEYISKISSIPGVKIKKFSISNCNKLCGFLNLIKLYFILVFNRERYKSINIQWMVVPFLCLCVCFIVRDKLVFTLHNSKPHNSKNKKNFFNKIITRFSKVNLFVSEYTKGVFEKDYDYFSSKNFVLNHGVMPLTDCNPPKKFKIDNSTKKLNLIFWGNVKDYKGLDFIVHFAPQLTQLGIPIKVYGKYDTDLLYIHDELKRLGQQSINEYLPLDFIENILIDSDNLLILPYKNSSQSGIMYNALSIGIPFICSNTGESAEFLKTNGLEKLVFEYGNYDSLVNAIQYYRNNKNEIVQKIRMLMSCYSWDYSRNQLMEIFE